MFFFLSKTLSIIIYPLTLALLLLLVSAFARRRRRERAGRWPFWLGLAILYAFSLKPVSDSMLRPLEKPYENPALPANLDAIVVLGGAANLERSTMQHLELNHGADRFVEGVTLARQLPDTKLVFSGGSGLLADQTRREAPFLAAAAVRLGIPAERILVEAESRNTYENAVDTKRLLAEKKLHRFLLVTSAFHMKRSLACFHEVGLEPIPYAVDFRSRTGGYGWQAALPDVSNLADSSLVIKEYVGLWVYRLKGYGG
jgi:uncharacterized SAM-binding protein YcdF (DUF218 family)